MFIVCLFTGCPTPSERDQQWQQIQQTLQEGRLQEAKELLEDILPSLRNNGPTDERYGEAIFQLADIARREKKLDQAESYYWKALPLIAQSRGPEHVRMADPLTELATLYQQKDQPSVALPLLKRALAIREKSWGLSNKEFTAHAQALSSATDAQRPSRRGRRNLDAHFSSRASIFLIILPS